MSQKRVILCEMTSISFSDMLLGVATLRSLYTLLNYGNQDGSVNPFVQLLSTVDVLQASVDFHKLRGGTPLTESPFNAANISNASPSPSSVSSSTDTGDLTIPSSVIDNLNKITAYIPAILAFLALNSLVLLLVAIVGIVIFLRRNSRSKKGIKGMKDI